MKRRYRPRRLLRRPRPAAGRPRQLAALLLCLCLVLALVPPLARAAGYDVSFFNYDMTPMEGNGYVYSDVPEGAALYTAEELAEDGVSFSPQPGCTWYLYYPGGGETGSFGPHAIPDPAREGYTFRDWAVQNAAEGNIYTVTGNTVYVARYVSDAQYVLSLYYQFDNESHTVAAETDSLPFGWEDPVSIPLPDDAALAGLSPAILPALEGEEAEAAAAWLTRAIKDNTFSCMMNDDLLENCLAAGFVAWDESAGDYLRDENGNIQIGIPVTYRVTGEVEFTVAYYQQNAEDDGYTLLESQTGSVEGTTVVRLTEMEGMVPQYPGFTLTTPSAEDAERYTVNANGTTTINLYYDRNERYILYQMNGGAVREPLALRFGQAIPESALAAPARTGYTFAGWTWLDENGAAIDRPGTMPDHDLTLTANWTPDPNASTVTLVYWLENANDEGYTVAGQREISATAGTLIGYAPDGAIPDGMQSINDYLTPEAMEAAGIPDGEYFTFASADASAEFDPGVNGGPKTVSGDGTTVINLGFSRNEYTLMFHLGQSGWGEWVQERVWGWRDGWLWTQGYQWRYYYHFSISTGGNSNTNDTGNWTAGYTWTDDSVLLAEETWSPDSQPMPGYTPDPPITMTVGESGPYYVGGEPYTITAKYGAYISNLWPLSTECVDSEGSGYYLFTWGTHARSPYYQTHDNRNIIGVYPTMSADLIIDPENPDTAHHLTGYWQGTDMVLTHHYMFEAVPGTGQGGTPFSASGTHPVNTQGQGGIGAVSGKNFYEYDSIRVRTTAGGERQNAPEFGNLVYQYGCYSGDDVYFYYTYTDYTVTYHENNGRDDNEVTFHYLENMTLAQELEAAGHDHDYVPAPYVSQYGNEYTFGGWYSDAEFSFPVDWNAANPATNIHLYAKWIAPTFTLTLVVPEGTLYQDTLDEFEALGYSCAVSTSTDPETGLTTATYVVAGIPGGIQASQIVSERRGARSSLSLAFDYWGYEVNGTEQRYLFDESQYITSDLTLTARWKTEYTGQYTVRYLTQTDPGTGLEPVTVNGETWYRLLDDTSVTGAAVGSTVTVEAQPVEGYLSSAGSLSGVVAQEGTEFNFFYTQVSGSVEYTVHYVLDAGVDYGRAAPPEGVTRLAADKTVTVDQASLSQSTAVRESAVVVGGYSPRDGWTASFTLSADAAQNHLYIYYVPNTYTMALQVVYRFADAAGDYTSGTALTFRLNAALGRVFTSGELTQRYQELLADHDLTALEQAMVGHELDSELTEPFLVVTQGENVYHIYLKNAAYTLTYCLEGSDDFPADWADYDDFLTEAEDGGYVQSVAYPAGATPPATQPTRLGHTFLGWSETSGGTPIDMQNHNWFQEYGMTEDHALYAVWQAQPVVSYDLRVDGARWNETGPGFYEDGDSGRWLAYVDSGDSAPRPADPSLVTAENVAYAFVGWTATDPESDEWDQFVGADGRVDLDTFDDRFRYTFTEPVTGPVTLYAVWDPDVTGVTLKKVNGGGELLAGVSFTLERIQAEVTRQEDGGYTFTLPGQNPDGTWPLDASFPARSVTTDGNGGGAFENLPAGYYLLTETAAPEGYLALESAAVLHLPYGEGTPEVVETYRPAKVAGEPSDNGLTVTVTNTAQYAVEISYPTELVLTYTPPDLIWNPETLAYEGLGETEGSWAVTAEDGKAISVTNRSPASPVQVSVQLTYGDGYTALLPLSHLSATDGSGTSLEGFDEETTDNSLAMLGSLSVDETAVFSLTVGGAWPGGPAALPPVGPAGTITISVTHPRRLNPAWQ